ncbi:MAG TPA: hypothetical protein VLZ81_07745 [Blastocatellia bacterium]|nr:hypothetical protein [Blastocatellia bacterium]
MASRVCFLRALLILLAQAGLLATAAYAQSYPQQQSGQPAGQAAPQASDPEVQAAKKVQAAADPATALQAADEFVKKFPKSNISKNVAQIVMAKIAKLPDANQRITFSETFQNTFKGPDYDDIIFPVLIDAYVKAERLDDAFQKTDAYLQRHPDDVVMLTQMSLVASDQIKRRNAKYTPQAKKYGAAAAAIIEANKKPADMADTDWAQYRTKWLAQLYVSFGTMSLIAGNEADAQAKIQKALTLNPTEPFSYVLLASITNNHYQALANQYKSMPPGADQDATLKKALTEMDQLIDYYAHAVALSENNPPYKQLHDQVLQDLQSFYKYRHKSEDGLQQLIDKYKKPAAAGQ